jgi:glycosyltransferase involved in cell wall biosynthesis
MNESPTLSVIITTADEQGDLRRALDSVFAQTTVPMEILVAGPARALAHQFDDRVRKIDVDTQNISAQRNAAMRCSRGELIALLEASAVWSPTKLARSVAALTRSPEDDLVYTPAVFINPDGTRQNPPAAEFLPQGWILDEIFEEPWIVDSTVVFRRAVWERQGGFDERLNVSCGQNFYLRAGRAHRFGVVPDPLADVYRAATVPAAEHAQNVRETAEMLHRFYAEQGGDERLDSRRARRALGELCEAAARLSWDERNIPMTLRASLGAMHYRPSWRSRLFFYWVLWRTRKERANLVLTPT